MGSPQPHPIDSVVHTILILMVGNLLHVGDIDTPRAHSAGTTLQQGLQQRYYLHLRMLDLALIHGAQGH